MLKIPNVKCPLQVDTRCLKCLITGRGAKLELKMINLDLETKTMIYTISPTEHYKILTHPNLFTEDLAKEAQYQEAAEKSMQLETKVSVDPFLQTHHFMDTSTSSLNYRQFSWLKISRFLL